MSAPAFDEMSWHDNLIYGLHLRCPDPDRELWRSDLLLDIDHIIDWVCGADGDVQFRIAAATLAFHDVGRLGIDIDYAQGWGDGLTELSIGQIRQEADADPGPRLKRHRFHIELNVPQGGSISFLASGHTLSLRGPVHQMDQQCLPGGLRPAMIP